MAHQERILGMPTPDAVTLTTSSQGMVTVFGLEGDRRSAADSVTEALAQQGYKVRPWEHGDADSPVDQSRPVEFYGVWPHLGQQAIAALSEQLGGAMVVDQRDPAVIRVALTEPSNGKVAPAGSVSRAA